MVKTNVRFPNTTQEPKALPAKRHPVNRLPVFQVLLQEAVCRLSVQVVRLQVCHRASVQVPEAHLSAQAILQATHPVSVRVLAQAPEVHLLLAQAFLRQKCLPVFHRAIHPVSAQVSVQAPEVHLLVPASLLRAALHPASLPVAVPAQVLLQPNL